ncbi:MAG: CocE/NonD family hydrolase [Myxococcota bacterium]|nr:CocE/NonD family hydrolase [Myxococcota bacterium]
MIRRALRRIWKLPERHCRSEIESEWLRMRDGVRLSTLHIWPIEAAGETPTILIRTPYGVNKGRSMMGVIGRLLAESGYHVVLQDVRGRYESEGSFEPFLHEREDGRDTLDWIEQQSWHSGKIGLFGASYVAYTAWSILAEAPDRVDAMISAIGSYRLYNVFYGGGALALRNAFEWGLTVGTQRSIPEREIDLERGLRHRPVYEGDRVALREVSWLREWVKRNRKDDYWTRVDLPLPDALPPTLMIAGWYDFFLRTQLEDFDALSEIARRTDGPAPRLVIGPWCHGLPARAGWWRHELGGSTIRHSIQHFDQNLKGADPTPKEECVRYFSAGDDAWHSSPTWPPTATTPHRFHLRSRNGMGALEEEAAGGDEDFLSFTDDPDSPHGTVGGALFAGKAGIKDQRKAVRSSDNHLAYTSAPLESDLKVAGPIQLEIFFSTDAQDADLFAQLIEVFPNGREENITDTMQRLRWLGVAADDSQPQHSQPGKVEKLSLQLTHTARKLSQGNRLRLIIAGSNFPTYDRNPGTLAPPALAKADDFFVARHQLHHGGELRPHLTLSVRP